MIEIVKEKTIIKDAVFTELDEDGNEIIPGVINLRKDWIVDDYLEQAKEYVFGMKTTLLDEICHICRVIKNSFKHLFDSVLKFVKTKYLPIRNKSKIRRKIFGTVEFLIFGALLEMSVVGVLTSYSCIMTYIK